GAPPRRARSGMAVWAGASALSAATPTRDTQKERSKTMGKPRKGSGVCANSSRVKGRVLSHGRAWPKRRVALFLGEFRRLPPLRQDARARAEVPWNTLELYGRTLEPGLSRPLTRA